MDSRQQWLQYRPSVSRPRSVSTRLPTAPVTMLSAMSYRPGGEGSHQHSAQQAHSSRNWLPRPEPVSVNASLLINILDASSNRMQLWPVAR